MLREHQWATSASRATIGKLRRTGVRLATIAAVTDLRATERLLEFIAERCDDERVQAAVAELQRRGDTLVRGDDLRLVSAAANHGRQFGPSGDTDYTGFEAALERIESTLGRSL